MQYLCIVMIFAALYLALAQDQSCRLNLDTFLDGYYFSLETMVSTPSIMPHVHLPSHPSEPSRGPLRFEASLGAFVAAFPVRIALTWRCAIRVFRPPWATAPRTCSSASVWAPRSSSHCRCVFRPSSHQLPLKTRLQCHISQRLARGLPLSCVLMRLRLGSPLSGPLFRAQIFMSIFIDAVFIGLIFLRFSRPQKRSSSLVFSPLACVRRETDAVTGAVTGLVLEVRLAELRRYELIEARVRVYALRHERTPRAEEEGAILFQSQQLELSSPPTTSGQGEIGRAHV